MDLWQTEEKISVRIFEGGRADLKVGLPSSAPQGFFFLKEISVLLTGINYLLSVGLHE